jgi:hypothetical protein
MKKYYIPTSSLNFNNILSSESISPKAFYQARSFGYSRWYTIPENPYENSLVLYDQLCYFSRAKSDYEDHPLLIEITIDETIESALKPVGSHVFLCNQTIFIDPFSSRLLFFREEDKRIALSLSEPSIETKFVWLYNSKTQVVVPIPKDSYLVPEVTEELEVNSTAIEKDKRINRMKGLLYGYYIGVLLSASKELILKLNTAREIQNILAAVLSSFDHKPTTQQREQLKTLYTRIQPEIPIFSKLSNVLHDTSLVDAVISIVREEYGYIKGEVDVNKLLGQLLATPTSQDARNPIMENINSRIERYEQEISQSATPLSVEDSQIVVSDGSLLQLNISDVSDPDKLLYKAWVNDVLSKDEYSGKTSTFKKILSDDVTMKAKELCETEWKRSDAKVTLNALRRHVGGEEFIHNWGNDIYSAIAAVVLRGDDWQKMLRYMQQKEMSDYRLAFSMFGTVNGFANLPRDFTDVLFKCGNSEYIANVYKEFYRQLMGHSIIAQRNAEQPIIDFEIKPYVNHKYTINSTDNTIAVQADETLNKGGGTPKKGKSDTSKHGKSKKGANSKATNDDVIQPTFPFADSHQSTGQFLTDCEFLVNNPEFRKHASAANEKWEEDLRWFIEVRNPAHPQHKKYYQDGPADNDTMVKQFLGFKKCRYKSTESVLFELYLKK